MAITKKYNDQTQKKILETKLAGAKKQYKTKYMVIHAHWEKTKLGMGKKETSKYNPLHILFNSKLYVLQTTISSCYNKLEMEMF